MTSSLPRPLENELFEAMREGIEQRIFSGASASFCIKDEPVQTVVAGTTAYDSQTAITPQTLFDIASITKLFTATLALSLIDKGALSLQSPIANGLTLESLLAHESGLPAWMPLFQNVPLPLRGTSEGYRQIVEAALQTPIKQPAPVSAVYSDLGFIILGHQLQQLQGQSLPAQIRDAITRPLAMHHTVYATELPLHHSSIAATEHCPWRGKTLVGEVHDDNTWSMGGIAGHAGIFSTSADLVRLGRAWLDAQTTDGIIGTPLARKAVERRPAGRGLGVDLKSPLHSSAGDAASEFTFGHLGFTGTSLWVDPQRDAVVCLLTNRVHPSRDNDKIRAFRPRFHQLFFQSIPRVK